MTTYSIRCRNSACRHRRVSKMHPDDYKVVPRCQACGERKGWRIENRGYNKRNLCECSGPEMSKGQAFPHQVTHPLCDHHTDGPINQHKHRGGTDDDLPLDLLGRKVTDDEPVPF